MKEIIFEKEFLKINPNNLDIIHYEVNSEIDVDKVEINTHIKDKFSDLDIRDEMINIHNKIYQKIIEIVSFKTNIEDTIIKARYGYGLHLIISSYLNILNTVEQVDKKIIYTTKSKVNSIEKPLNLLDLVKQLSEPSFQRGLILKTLNNGKINNLKPIINIPSLKKSKDSF